MIKKPKHKKIKTLPKLKGEVWNIFSRYIRMRDCLKTMGILDWGNCITCTALIRLKDGDAGHFIQGRMNSILFEETCVHLQCHRCNRFLGGEPLKYRRAIIRLYGEGYDIKLEEQAMETRKFSRTELEDMKKEYQEKIKELEQEV